MPLKVQIPSTRRPKEDCKCLTNKNNKLRQFSHNITTTLSLKKNPSTDTTECSAGHFSTSSPNDEAAKCFIELIKLKNKTRSGKNH
jgi:hypothetical protein